jgi:hypothetical protein
MLTTVKIKEEDFTDKHMASPAGLPPVAPMWKDPVTSSTTCWLLEGLVLFELSGDVEHKPATHNAQLDWQTL